MLKLGRNYILEIGLQDGSNMVIKYPTTLQFATRRDVNASAGTGEFRIFNLSQQHRNLIFKDVSDNFVKGHVRKLSVRGGYGDNLSYIFYGDVSQAGSYRGEGGVDFITQIDGLDGGASRLISYSSWTLAGPVSKQAVIERLSQDMERGGSKVGKISSFPGIYPRGYVANDYTWNLLVKETDSHCFVYNDLHYCMDDDAVVDGPVFRLSSDTGLLGSPKKCDTYVVAELLFEPTLFVGQQVVLDTKSFTLFNGTYKIHSVSHMGMISGAVNSKCKTVIELYVRKRVEQLIGA